MPAAFVVLQLHCGLFGIIAEECLQSPPHTLLR